MQRKATAIWAGSGRDGTGTLTTESGVLDQTPLTFKARFGDEKGANPEELIAAAHAGCFTMALAFALQGAGYVADSLTTNAAVTLEAHNGGFTITHSALSLQARVPGLSETDFTTIAADAKQNCPVSKLLNAQITLDAKLV